MNAFFLHVYRSPVCMVCVQILQIMLVSRKGIKLGPMLLLTINRKPYIRSPMAHLHLTLSDLERSNSRSPIFQSPISRKGAELGPILVLTINRKPHIGSPMTSRHLTLSDLERSKSRSPNVQNLISRKRA